ncbi:MAG: hypothetical protein FJ317_02505 [SAR202 cluster bacterium]|nr:hypothetical protein [SAR202 cluster bacterium]
MLNFLWWLIASYAISLAAFPIAYYLFPRLKDRGYTVSRPLGLLIIGYLSWILSVAHILPAVRISAIFLLLAMGAASAWLFWRKRDEILAFVSRERRLLLATEAVFLVVFIGWAVYRAFDPYISHTEQPMDFAFLNASMRTFWGQPQDPWLSGHSVSYYYFGYWLMAGMAKLTGVQPAIAYNLSLALVPALAASAVFGLTFNLVSLAKGRWGIALASGLLAAILLAAAANLEGVLEFMRANGIGGAGFWEWVSIQDITTPAAQVSGTWHPTEFWWWWRATRLINTFDGGVGLDYTIAEFPVFSLILGDLHPHLMSLAFIPVFLAFCLQFFLSPLPRSSDRRPQTWLPVLVLAFLLGALGFINAWDLPVFMLLLVGLVGLKAFSVTGRNLRSVVATGGPVVVAVLVIAFLLYLPYWTGFRSQFSGLHPVGFTTRPFHFLLVWGVFLTAVVPLVVASFWTTIVRKGWAWIARLSVLIVFLPFIVWAFLSLWIEAGGSGIVGRFFHTLPVTVLAGLAIYTVMWLKEPGTAAARNPSLRLPLRVVDGEPDTAGTVRELGETASRLGGEVLWANDWGGDGNVEAGLKPPQGMSLEQFNAAVLEAFTGTPAPEPEEQPAQAATDAPSIDARAFALLLAALGLVLVLVPDLLYVGDFFGTRMNTVFKFYYQAWLVLAVAGGFALYYWHSSRPGLQGYKRTLSNLWAAVFVILLVGSLYYPPAAAVSKAELALDRATLDGLGHLTFESPGELEAILYLREHAGRDAVLLEAVGGEYTAFGRVSSSSGVPAVLGWAGHERQWRGSDSSFVGREDDIRKIYTTPDPDEAKNLMRRYNVEYVYVGPRERAQYGSFGTGKFASFMEPVVTFGDVVLYKRISGSE